MHTLHVYNLCTLHSTLYSNILKPTQPRRRGALRVQERHVLQTGHACDDAAFLWSGSETTRSDQRRTTGEELCCCVHKQLQTTRTIEKLAKKNKGSKKIHKPADEEISFYGLRQIRWGFLVRSGYIYQGQIQLNLCIFKQYIIQQLLYVKRHTAPKL